MDGKREELAERKTKLTPAQRALLDERLRGNRMRRPVADSIPRVVFDGAAPLSLAQTRLWFLNELEPGNPFYNESVIVRLTGPLDVGSLQRAVSATVDRHEGLRTTFVNRDGEAGQVVHDQMPTTITGSSIDVPEVDRQGAIEHLAVANARRPFELARGPLFRFDLYRLGPQDHVFHAQMHHVIADGLSIMKFIAEMGMRYESHLAGAPISLPPLPIRYRDYAVWQRTRAQTDVLDRQIAYWRDRLSDVATLHLPTDRPHPERQTFRGARASLVLDADLTVRLRQTAQENSATLFMVVMAVFQVWLRRATGQTDVAVGIPVANRTRPETQELIGFFVNTIVIRSDLSGRPSFRTFLERVRGTVLAAQENQDVPFERVVEALRPDRTAERNPLFQVMLVLHDVLAEQSGPSGLSIAPIELDHATAKFDLTLFVANLGDRLRLTFEYATDLFEGSTIERMLGQLATLLEAVVGTSDLEIDRLPLLADAQRAALLQANTVVPGSPGAASMEETVASGFAAQALRTPLASAVAFEGRTLTYRELDRRANRLARALRARGVRAEIPVAVAVERSADAVVALLGVMKAGGVFVPLDLHNPQSRLAAILDRVRPAVIVADAEGKAVLPAGFEPLALDALIDGADGDAAPPSALTPANAAYMIFTSGSTGLPKGVVVEHRQLCSYVRAVSRRLDLPDGIHAATVSTLAADLGHTALFPPLFTGGCVHVIAEDRLTDADALAAYFDAHRIDLLKIVPAHLEALLSARGSGEVLPRACLVFGGDVLSWDLADRVRALAPSCRVFNHYGPTETTVGVVAGALSDQTTGERPPVVPLGRPLDGSRILILDDELELVPPGLPGEIYIGGDQLARGYFRQPAFTAERFVPDPFGAPGARLYRTGDGARLLSDGRVMFLGRVDQQVKIRGYRIELGEVRQVLISHPLVRDAIALAHGDGDGQRRLVSYVVQETEAGLAAPGAEATAASQVENWREVFEDLYQGSDAHEQGDPALNLTGWISSYTGDYIDREQMRTTVEETVRAIRAIGGRRILEIGCGIGLLVHRLAPEAERYVGTDFSSQALGYLRSRLAAAGVAGNHIELQVAAADDFSRWQGPCFDLVVLNSVVQYFSTGAYLHRVLEGAYSRLSEGGAVFVGDVRSLPLLEPFCASIELFRAANDLTTEELRQRIRRRMAEEEELVIDPLFFHDLAAQLPGAELRIIPKRGHHRNELTAYRYDVVLRRRGGQADRAIPWEPWECRRLSADQIRALLLHDRPPLLGLAAVPNARNEEDRRRADLLGQADQDLPIAELRRQLSAGPPAPGLDPNELWEMAEAVGYEVALGISTHGSLGALDVVFRRPDTAPVDLSALAPVDDRRNKNRSPRLNQPLFGSMARRLVAELRRHVAERLPDYMVPSAIVVIEKIPLTANGKIDTRRLPPPDAARGSEGGYVGPREGIEDLLCQLWSELLGTERVGVFDDFFALGGHSLMATQMLSRVRQAFRVEIQLRDLFEATTVAALARRIRAARQRSDGGVAIPQLARAAEGDGFYPLSYAQQRFWFLDHLHPGNAAYNLHYYTRMQGRFDRRAAVATLREIVRRQEMLRTRFVLRDGVAFQVVEPEGEVDLPVVDLTAVPPPQREAAVRAEAQSEVSRPFDLTRPAPFRSKLLVLEANEHVLLLTIHHIASDAWSRGVFVRELALLYDAFAAGRPPSLPPLPVQYRDYAVWQRSWLQGEQMEKQVSWWRQELAEVPAVLALPTDRPRPARVTFNGASEPVRLPSALVTKLKGLTQQANTTLFMALLASFGAVLGRYARQDRFLIGTPIANRTQMEVEPLVGFFANTLAMKVDLAGHPSFFTLLERARTTALGAYTYQDLPFEKLVEELAPAMDLSRHPLFQVMFVFQNTPQPVIANSDVTLTSLEFHSGKAMFDLTLALAESRGEVIGLLEYNTDLFDAATAARLVRHFATWLETAVADPQCSIDDISLMSATEQGETLAAAGAAAVEWEDRASVETTIAARMRTDKDAEALRCDGRSWTYQAIDDAVSILAHRLRGLGAGRETIVAVNAHRSVELVIALHAILRCGAAYLPLDPEGPAERIKTVLRDARPCAALLAPGTVFPGGVGIPTLALDDATLWRTDGRSLRDDRPLFAANGAAADDSLAYVIYTSGSTGRPKGAMNSRRGLANRLWWKQRYFPIGPGDRVLQKTPYTFDVSVWELFWPFLTGATMVVARPGGHRDAGYLVDLIQREQITTAHFVPSMLQVFLDWPGAERCAASLRRVICSGEALTGDLAARFFQRLPGVKLFNLYGPTEAAIDVTAWECGVDDVRPGVPIGFPIANTQMYVLDRELRPVTAGVVGELFIGGLPVGRGYLGAPGLTAERFVPDPYAAKPGARLYRTGDLGRSINGGVIEYRGRLDDQVKIRGHRIELGEVQAALEGYPGIRQAVVTVHADRAGGSQLVAYVVPATEPWDTGACREYLRALVPAAYIPTLFVPLPQLPLSANGKVDRRGLPAPGAASAHSGRSYVAPRTAVERDLVAVWEDLIGRPVGVEDHFFDDLGGHSLLALRLLARIEERFNVELSLIRFFDGPTVEQVARALPDQGGRAAGAEIKGPLVRLREGGAGRSLVLAHAVDGTVSCYHDLAVLLGDRHPVFALQAPTPGSDGPSPASIEAMAAGYLTSVRERFGDAIPVLGGWSMGGAIAFEMARQLSARGQPAPLLVIIDRKAQTGASNQEPLGWMVGALSRSLGREIAFDAAGLHELSADELLAKVTDALEAAGHRLDMRERLYLQGFLRHYRPHVRLLATYKPAPFAQKTVVLCSEERSLDEGADSTLGWRALVGDDIAVHRIGGDHHTMIRQPFAQQLAACLRPHLEDI